MKRFSLFLAWLLSFTLWLAPVQADSASWLTQDLRIRRGMTCVCSYAGEDTVTVYLTEDDGTALCTLPCVPDESGGHVIVETESLTEGTYRLFLVTPSGNDTLTLFLLPALPQILSLDAPYAYSKGFPITVECNQAGTLSVIHDARIIAEFPAESGENTLTLSALALPEGEQTLTLVLRDAEGNTSEPASLTALFPAPPPPQPATDTVYFTPSHFTGNTCSHTACYWNLPMGEIHEEAIWQVLTAPLTVLSGVERKQYKVRSEPDKNCKTYTGEVTYASQGVHVLERGDEWSLIEAFSSSVEGSSVKVYAKHFTGYVETRLLKEVPVSQNIGIVIDKLQQRLYVFRDGALYSTLLCSTGYARADTPFNETPAGEYLAISHTGGFWSGNLFCDLAIRINDGILLHEVPCLIDTLEDGTEERHYERCEQYLGEKASHGCIRIQKEQSTGGVNMKWLWENLPRSGTRAKVIIWEDTGRTLQPASDDYLLYYNPNNGRQYHSDPYCPLVNARFYPLTAFPYALLDEAPYASLARCPGCAPQLRKSEIDTANAKNKSQAWDIP